MSLDSSTALLDRFHVARTVLNSSLPRRRRVGRTYQGFIKALMGVGSGLHLRVQALLRDAMHSVAGQYTERFGWAMFAVDGTKIDCVRSHANLRHFGIASKKKSHPQQLLTTLYHMGTGLPWAWVTGCARDSERRQLWQMIELLPKGALLVADAGFTGFELLRALHNAERFFLVRVGGNVRLLRELGYAEVERDNTVYLWPKQFRSEEPLVLRLIKVPTDGEPAYLITNVLDRKRLDDKTAGKAYQMRWGVEIFYRSIKQTLDRRKMRSAAPTQTMLELHWTLIGVMLLGMLSVAGIIRRGQDPLGWSVANAVREIRRCMHAPMVSVRTLRALLTRAVKDTYCRGSAKAGHDLPRKKAPPTMGAPKIRKATPAEVPQAQMLITRERQQ